MLEKMNLTFFSSDKTLRDSCTSLLLHNTCLLFDHIKLQSSRGCFRPLKSQLNWTNNNTTRLQKKLNKNKNLHYIIITSCLLQKIATFHIYLGWLMKPLPLYLKSSWWGKINYTFSFSNLAYPNKNWKQF